MKKSTKELLYKSVYREIFYHVDTKMLEMNYLSGTTDYTDEEYKQEMLSLHVFFAQKDVQIYYINATKFDYIIVPEMQEWLEKTVKPMLVKSGIRKMTIIASNQVFSRVSMRQTLDRFTDIPYEAQYFTDKEAGLTWLLT